MPSTIRRRRWVDRYVFSPSLPGPPSSSIPSALQPHLALYARIQDLLNVAIPPPNDPLPTPHTLFSLQRALTALEDPLNQLSLHLERGNEADADYAFLTAEAQIPSLLVDMLLRLLRLRTLADSPHVLNQFPSWRNFRPLFRNAGPIFHILDSAVLLVLRTLNFVAAAHDLLAARLVDDRRLLPLLFAALSCMDAVELALSLVEELLHAPRCTLTCDLSAVPNLPALIQALTPYQMGLFCRVLAPLVDEREAPMCGGDYCSGACGVTGGVDDYWQQIESPEARLRARRTYVGNEERVLRDRNHAVLLAVPHLFNKLVKLLSVPPAPRDELVIVDHALRSGTGTLSTELPELFADISQLITAEVATEVPLQLSDEGELVWQLDGLDGPGENARLMADGVLDEEALRKRVLYLELRRVSGMDKMDSTLAGCDGWDMLDVRIRRATADYANKWSKEGIFRERRRPNSAHGVDGGLSRQGSRMNPADILFPTQLYPPDDGPLVMVGGRSLFPILEHEDLPDEEGSGAGTVDSRNLQARDSDSVGERWTGRLYMSVNSLLMGSHQVEVLFVLYLLLIGRRKAEVQRRLIDEGIFPVLVRFCDALDWRESENDTKTEESLKVHLIRVLHYLCDGLDGSRGRIRLESLYSNSEVQTIKSIEDGIVPMSRGIGPLLPLSSHASLHDPALIGLRGLSITPSSPWMSEKSESISRNNPDSNKRSQQSTVHSETLVPLLSERPPRVVEAATPEKKNSHQKEVASSDLSTSENVTCQNKEKLPTVSEDGIVCKIVRILMLTTVGEGGESPRRYLLSGCLETLLRTASNAEKTLVAHQGLLVYLIKQLAKSVETESPISQMRQASFDLLGQLVTWNRDLFGVMNELFRQDPKLLPLLLKAVSERLVDSNVFVRSIVISLERFKAEDELAQSVGIESMNVKEYDFDDCLLWEFVETYRFQLVHDLLTSVRVEDVNFENICCVNTTLIILVTSCHCEDSLNEALSKVADIAIETISGNQVKSHSLFTVNHIDLFQNFEKLVTFWLNYYQYQGADVASQELSSNIRFDRLVAIAMLLKERLPALDSRLRRETQIAIGS